MAGIFLEQEGRLAGGPCPAYGTEAVASVFLFDLAHLGCGDRGGGLKVCLKPDLVEFCEAAFIRRNNMPVLFYKTFAYAGCSDTVWTFNEVKAQLPFDAEFSLRDITVFCRGDLLDLVVLNMPYDVTPYPTICTNRIDIFHEKP
jgi:hypothetical protein